MIEVPASVLIVLILGAITAAYLDKSRFARDTIEEPDVSGVERSILVHLHREGNNIAGNIAKDSGHHPSSIVRSASNLEEEGLITNLGNGVYRLTVEGEEIAGLLREREELSEGEKSD